MKKNIIGDKGSMQLNIENLTNFHSAIPRLKTIASDLSHRDIDLIICDDEFIKNINLEHRRKTDSTDVLSFPIRGIKGDPSHIPLGSIVISIDKVNHAAKIYGHTPDEEIQLLFIHGLLHLLGYDHARDQGEMREKERKLITSYNLPPSLIVRAEG